MLGLRIINSHTKMCLFSFTELENMQTGLFFPFLIVVMVISLCSNLFSETMQLIPMGECELGKYGITSCGMK